MKTPKNRKVCKIDIRAIITSKGKKRIILLFEETEIRDFLMTRHTALNMNPGQHSLSNYIVFLKKKGFILLRPWSSGVKSPILTKNKEDRPHMPSKSKLLSW